eukprot:g14993.t1
MGPLTQRTAGRTSESNFQFGAPDYRCGLSIVTGRRDLLHRPPAFCGAWMPHHAPARAETSLRTVSAQRKASVLQFHDATVI